MKKRMAGLLLATVLCFNIFAACNNNGSQGEGSTILTGDLDLPHYDQMTEGKEYNHNLFYQNDMLDKAADTSVIYIEEGEEAGYFYLYATCDAINTYGFQGWRSKDLVNWQEMGIVFVPDANSWYKRYFWAPEVVYYEGKYYMYFCGSGDTNFGNSDSIENLGLAISDNPYGPFVQWTGETSDGRDVGLGDIFIDPTMFAAGTNGQKSPKDTGTAIDASPFIDDDGEIYMYFTVVGDGNKIWGMRMKDMVTPDYPTAVLLAESNRKTPGGEAIAERSPVGNNVNEGSFTYKHNGKYYLTFSPNGFRFPNYSVNQAISDNPLGPFVKVDFDKGGRIISYQGAVQGEYNYDFVAGTGHGSMCKVGDDLLYFYHAYLDRETLSLNEGNTNPEIKSGRGLCVDRVFFVNNGEQEILYANGPSYSLQPLPEVLSGYKNIALSATVTATNTKEGSSADFLKDYLFKSHDLAFIKEFEVEGQTTTITLKWDTAQTVRAVMVYNAFNYLNSFDKIEEIRIKSTIEGRFEGWAVVKDLAFDMTKHAWVDLNDASEGQMRPGGSAIAEFNEITTDEIIITITGGKADFENVMQNLIISDIVVLGK